MAKYINADALFDETGHLACYDNRDRDAFENLILSMPAADVEPVERWISVDERLPEYEGSYLVCTANSGAFIGHYHARSKSFSGGRGRITHWMDRPEPPKMDGGSE